ncbi:putative RecB family exonuclease [Streptoalloteichus tenebrarius]|uniref:RecB family exonuclease n=1 Tax=Streptoalloteichus tenebrarius (strain ATCC 17920 / DSM 40477 / JCM 4838 / CBS 697.72 / NBRC 16177 / NCIMB 11028 / NRRL B-12390 / A12253. 1 / ISP 5477) TaxID=1933 RepID=A0ABT1HP67_STRSD|nr:RecB family exonuclease [Streptoalloteichus tenebrarius]MCP2257305.1 putative RecB family exonuclease [Streptoalloteichus tenebrarius]BFF04215.1 RecB family exonuclease [Streptoalloteichus tenebrarius]
MADVVGEILSSTDSGNGVDDEGPRRTRRPALSPSRASDFKQCPLLYRFRAVDRLPEKPTRAQIRGTVVHAVLEKLFALPAVRRVPDEARALLEPAWQELLASRPELSGLFDDAEDADTELREWLASATRLLDHYFGLEDPRRLEPEACELLVEAELASGVLLRGYIDRLDVAPTGEIRVVDYKTGTAPREIGEAKALFQMKFYALVLWRTRGVVPRQLRLMYLADRQSLAYTPDEGELRRFERTLEAMWDAILRAGRTGDFRPNPSRLCDWCDHKAFCPAFGGTPPEYPGWPDPLGLGVETVLDRAD